eukprot:SAG31_NODE_269_length_18741_cov_11.185441_3_plen_321_part_00
MLVWTGEHGECTAGACQCADGWSGDRCETKCASIAHGDWIHGDPGYVTDENIWRSAVDFCVEQGADGICPLEIYCPEGQGFPPVGGTRVGDQWAPYGGDGENRWVQVGSEIWPVCMVHQDLATAGFSGFSATYSNGNPQWGDNGRYITSPAQRPGGDQFYTAWVLCCSVDCDQGLCSNEDGSPCCTATGGGLAPVVAWAAASDGVDLAVCLASDAAAAVGTPCENDGCSTTIRVANPGRLRLDCSNPDGEIFTDATLCRMLDRLEVAGVAAALFLHGLLFDGLSAGNGWPYSNGGAVYLNSGSASVLRSLFRNNNANVRQ